MQLSKTSLGQQVIKDRSVSLTPPQRSALILVDGKRSDAEILKMTAAVGVTMTDLETLVALELIHDLSAIAPEQVAAMPSGAAQGLEPLPVPASSSNQIDFHKALNETILLCSNLGFKGFGLNMALADVNSLAKLQKLAPEIRRVAGDKKYEPLHQAIFGKPL